MVSEQFQIAERLDRKARYQVASAGAFFAVVQAIAVNAITRAGLPHDWTAALAVVALPPALLTIGAFVTAANAWRTQTEDDLPVADLREMTDRIQRGDNLALRELAHHYLNLVERRRVGNETRVERVKKTSAAAILSIGLSGLELVLIFVALSNHG
jgi:hypothetical protein